jgi:hypothetical protein
MGGYRCLNSSFSSIYDALAREMQSKLQASCPTGRPFPRGFTQLELCVILLSLF